MKAHCQNDSRKLRHSLICMAPRIRPRESLNVPGEFGPKEVAIAVLVLVAEVVIVVFPWLNTAGIVDPASRRLGCVLP